MESTPTQNKSKQKGKIAQHSLLGATHQKGSVWWTTPGSLLGSHPSMNPPWMVPITPPMQRCRLHRGDPSEPWLLPLERVNAEGCGRELVDGSDRAGSGGDQTKVAE
eukprot:2352005-Karenia_brevis.AAC.1